MKWALSISIRDMELGTLLQEIPHYLTALRGHRWMLDPFETRSPRREWLDEITGERPMYLFSGNAHDVWFNTAAMRAAGIGPDTADPDPRAQYWVRDPDGTPTGHAV